MDPTPPSDPPGHGMSRHLDGAVPTPPGPSNTAPETAKPADHMLELVLDALTRAGDNPETLFELLHQAMPGARVTALIHGLLTADHAMRTMFRDTEASGASPDLARAAAQALAEAASEVDLAASARHVVLSDLLG